MIENRKKKNGELAALIKERAELMEKQEEISTRLKKISGELDKWRYEDTGPFEYQRMAHVLKSLREGERPVSIQDAEDAAEFDPPEDLKEKAARFGKAQAKRQKR